MVDDMVAACKVDGVDMGHRVDLVEEKWRIFEYFVWLIQWLHIFFLFYFIWG